MPRRKIVIPEPVPEMSQEDVRKALLAEYWELSDRCKEILRALYALHGEALPNTGSFN